MDAAPVEEPPQPAGESVRQDAHASGQASITQAGRDVHLHYEDGVRRAETAAPGGVCPYPGLASFGRGEARWFFGRDKLTAALITRLDERLSTGGMQIVVAPSGAGKSSLLHAGLLPKLADGALDGSADWPVLTLTPTADPLAALTAQVAALNSADPAADPPVLLAALRDRVEATARVVVVVDQFEELFTLCTDDQQRRTFIALLHDLAEARVLVVLGVRADFYATCANYPALHEALEDRPLVVGPMSDTELGEAIRYPAKAVGLDVEPGLAALLLRDLGDTGTAGYAPGRLPLLAHALRSTWQQRHGHTLTVDGYLATGGIHRAVARTAEDVYADLDKAGQRLARTLFLRLVKIGDGGSDTRRRITRTELLRDLDIGAASPVVDTFTQKRLLTQEQDTVEITHEALLSAWPRLTEWIGQDRAGNLIRQNLDDDAADWDRNRNDSSILYRGTRLEAARAWAASTPNQADLSPTASAFLTASTHQSHRAARVRRAVIVVLSVLALLTSTTAAFALQQRAVAQNERDAAVTDQIIAQADRLRGTNVSLAAQLDLLAYRRRPSPDLRTALISTGGAALSTPLTGHTGPVTSVAFSPNGHTLATGSEDATARLWNVTDSTHPIPLGQLVGHTGPVASVAFSPDGHTLATSSDDKTARLWNVTDLTHPIPLGELVGHTGAVASVAFSPDGHTLATSSLDETARLWNVTDLIHPIPLGQLVGHTGTVTSVAFSPDGHTLATSSLDETARLWNVTDLIHPIPLGQLVGHTDAVESVAFSPDGHTLATSSDDKSARLWNVTDPTHPTPLGQLVGHTNTVASVAFSLDGHTLATGSYDTTARLWNVTDPTHPTPLGQLVGHTGAVVSVAFSLDGHTLATGSYDTTARLWDIPSTVLAGHTDVVTSVAFSPDEHILATGSVDTTARLWNITDPTPLGQLVGHNGPVYAVAFSLDGHTLATGSSDSTVRLWNVTDPPHPTSLGQLVGHNGTVFSVAFSPDGHTLATSSDNNTARLWNITDLTHPIPLGQPTGHTGTICSVAFSPDGHTLATGSWDTTARLWNVTDPTHPIPLGQLTGHTSAVTSVAFSLDGHTLATSSSDSTVRLWNVTDPPHPTPLGQLAGHTNAVFSVAFSPDGHTLASGSTDATVRLWDLDVDHAIRRICATTANNLTPAAWRQYVSPTQPDLPYQLPCP
jgi:WD40 repeat protein